MSLELQRGNIWSLGLKVSDLSLPSGIRLGPFEVTALLGTGGMGEVYRARDTKHPSEHLANPRARCSPQSRPTHVRAGWSASGWPRETWNTESHAFFRTVASVKEPVVALAIFGDELTTLADPTQLLRQTKRASLHLWLK